jgi:Fis family transcriptional regulator
MGEQGLLCLSLMLPMTTMPQSIRRKSIKNGSARKSGKKKVRKQFQSRNRLLSSFTEDALRSYFNNLNGHQPAEMYKLVLGEVEPSLFRTVLDYTDGNQTVAADILGINRATLRKKLKQYQLHT